MTTEHNQVFEVLVHTAPTLLPPSDKLENDSKSTKQGPEIELIPANPIPNLG